MRLHEQPLTSTVDDEEYSALLLGVARDVRKVVQEGPGNFAETTALNARLTQLRDRFHRGGETPLDRWFESLQNQLDTVCASAAL